MVSGGYVDDEDFGNEIVYTGQGGNDPSTKRRIADQTLTLGNAGLARSQLDGNPVRVVRGASGDPAHSPSIGFRPLDELGGGPADRVKTVIQRLVRSTVVANGVKQKHNYRCQVCGVQLMTAAGPYAEAAHIRALGKPHNGPDVMSNVLCLCPNHHVLFDAGAIHVDATGVVRDTLTGAEISKLLTVPGHTIDPSQLAYHRESHG
ncbi:HNH endonuclease [Dactylosporangium fulvum]|uniref:HNH endonuclease n=1 Tax=Dactylosporangium fulvum TaxID=53359 RepID=A0ABY5WBH9_9ACTN|nr:YDG/SRA domain-containing protein [Dactylosporangium fulvum]UWP86631.1 HNH endonuclease [Dactylosporangium fulvum]